MTARDSVAGRIEPSARAGAATCADMTSRAPASMPARNGTSSTAVSRSRDPPTDRDAVMRVDGRLAETREVLDPRRPRRPVAGRGPCAAPSRPTSAASSPNERIPSAGLAGLVATSMTGA